LDKIRLHDAGELPPEYHPNLGNGMDQRICRFLHVAYPDVQKQVRGGRSDEEVLSWCLKNGHAIDEVDIQVWNAFAVKRGWRDDRTEHLERQKQESGLAGRMDIQTMFELFEVEEKRRS
jgi:hypothetical protein